METERNLYNEKLKSAAEVAAMFPDDTDIFIDIALAQPKTIMEAIVTTGKNDVDHIVTEYGIAKLRGKTLSQRTKALIGIAHPKFREELTFAAKKRNILI